MNEWLLILSEDAVFARMLELEFRMLRIPTRVAGRAEAIETASVILVDLDTSLPPTDFEGRVIGFTRSFSILAADPERRCSMILHRPFSMELLTKEVRGILPEPPTVAFSSNPSVLTLKGTLLSYGERAVSLSKTEALLMESLLSMRPQAVSRETLASIIGTTATNKTEVYICFLRKKLEALTGNVMIRTVRGVGYRLQ